MSEQLSRSIPEELILPPLKVTSKALEELRQEDLQYPPGFDPGFVNYTVSHAPDRHHMQPPVWAGRLHHIGNMQFPVRRR